MRWHLIFHLIHKEHVFIVVTNHWTWKRVFVKKIILLNEITLLND